MFGEAISRSFTVINRTGSIQVFDEAISRAFTACNAAGLGDHDGDGDIDWDDFTEFANCFTGPDGGTPEPECEVQCEVFDFDCDGDIDCDDNWALVAASAYVFRLLGLPDCNSNGINDACELYGDDCNSNGVPDECDLLDVVSVCSLLSHREGGQFCLDLGTYPDFGLVEPRLAGPCELCCQMSVPVDPASVGTGGVQVVCLNNVYEGTIGVTLEQGAFCGDSQLMIEFEPALPDQDCCTITLDGMASVYGQPSVAEFAVRPLIGDTDRDGCVTTADGSAITQRLGMALDESNFWYDVDADGSITTADGSSVTQRLGNLAPACP